MPRPPWTPEQIKLLELYPELGPTALAPLLGKSMHTVAAYATKRGIRANDLGRGGKATRDRYGREHYVKAGKIGGAVTLDRHGRDHYARNGSLGRGRCRGWRVLAATAENREPFRMVELLAFREWLRERP